MRKTNSIPALAGLFLSVGFTLATAATASAASTYVASHGTDSGSCGTKTDPCRTITKGIDQATVGGTIVVGPGRYGDLDGDGTLGEAGEETPGTVNTSDCMIAIDKQVTVVSSAGAWSTSLNPGTAGGLDATVCLGATGTVFGAYGKGFTVRSPEFAYAGIYSLSVAGDSVVAGSQVQCASGGSYGIVMSHDNPQLLSSRASGCYLGFFLAGSGAVAKGNAAMGNTAGFAVNGADAVLDSNVSNGNYYGMSLGVTNLTMTRASVIDNTSYGIATGMGTSGSITGSNIVGNGTDIGTPNCGVYADGSAVTMDGNWWGAASGPGSDPADAVCVPGAPVSTFEDKPVQVKLKGIR